MSHSDEILTRLMTLHPKVIDLTLDRVERLLATLGHPERALPPVIHIAGTNGKGSTQAMIRAGLESQGKAVHAYTSPHLARFHERIRIAGALISEPDLSALLEECYDRNAGAPITFFEVTTCAAFLAFARTPADFTLLEVGLGGRLDATNVVERPALTIITPVSIDHQQFLGETLPEIAREKAGILKRGVTCVVGPQEEAALEVIEARAARVGAPLFVHGQHWHAFEERGRLIYQDENGLLDLPLPNLPGPHQIQNAGAAIAALRLLGLGNGAEAAVTRAEWPARMQRLREGPLAASAPGVELWLDGGHNPAGGMAVAATLARMAPRPTHLICGMINTKDVVGYMRPLVDQAVSLTAVTIPEEPNAVPAEVIEQDARIAGFITTFRAGSVGEALSAIAARDPSARVLICGSLYLAGKVLRENH
ncbi:bifunctional folylpolyglutamate synthase/dihydrofolate synthase [Paenirhodobacter populi]|uniref:bifunctional folylpolyglutamate synthase/dihydrofolate synthase n=1 Tax=Paenirhodobacter populi TaxID=2306993 RepID=UPI000FE2B4C3|nr:folylpolyglutamate synthase/dihydrofolate synthase family protein [Sinirhodobacter populi]RWR06594.1 bifunctional folylpolyglutamate synthase/dihydrofolate synthase [Sinirhodobacter populi]